MDTLDLLIGLLLLKYRKEIAALFRKEDDEYELKDYDGLDYKPPVRKPNLHRVK